MDQNLIYFVLVEQNFEKTDDWLREAHPYFASKPTVQIMKRQPNPSSDTNPTGNHVASNSQSQMTIQEREANYAKARAAIFSENQSNEPPKQRKQQNNKSGNPANAKNSKHVNKNSNKK